MIRGRRPASGTRGDAKCKKDSRHPETKICPFCAEKINREAIICRHCGGKFRDEGEWAKKLAVAYPVSRQVCLKCARGYPADVQGCEICGGVFVRPEEVEKVTVSIA